MRKSAFFFITLFLILEPILSFIAHHRGHGSVVTKTNSNRGKPVLLYKKENKSNNNGKPLMQPDDKSSWIDSVKDKPGTLVIAPFVLLFFLDIVANILVLTKRTLEYALTGEYTVWHL